MKMYRYWVTVRTQRDGRRFESRLTKECQAENDHLARRFILNQMLKEGHLVTGIDPAKEKRWV